MYQLPKLCFRNKIKIIFEVEQQAWNISCDPVVCSDFNMIESCFTLYSSLLCSSISWLIPSILMKETSPEADHNFAGYTLFLGLVIDRLHHYLRKMVSLKKTVGTSKEEVEKLKKEHLHFKDKEDKASSEMQELQREVGNLTEKLQKQKTECEQQEKRAVSAEAHVVSLQKQLEELLLEYDRLLEDNQILQCQLLSYRS